ncbi:hypothetical protein [Candidatus Nanohalococcus occultus]|uniref:Uncharacterized protein n=1 Tax=Candidatus Nanohalococcus occultus TaxID=2978047 RepID=A0ABY8CD43_9ARCH|nr:hypothetical protein SVXNc_0109 [Candidatus Nanohaloarchaeota archaeon SVXNc]
MDLERLPDSIRLKLEAEDERQLWERAEKKGLKTLAEENGFKPYNLYSWRAEKTFLPKKVVQLILENPEIAEIKGEGRSRPTKDFQPENITDELLTRISESVSVNKEGVPIYQNTDRGCAKRFIQLLDELGAVPYSVYDRDVYEVRYPKYLHEIFEKKVFEPVFWVKVDESGSVQNGRLEAEGKTMGVSEFDGRLYSREKRLQLAIERKDSKEIEELMAAEAARIREAFE